MKSLLMFLLLVWPTWVYAQPMHIQTDPSPSAYVDGWVPGLKISLNSHGDPAQPGAGDAVGLAVYADDVRRPRVWSSVFGVSVYGAGPHVAVLQELDLNNFGGDADEPGGPRSLYGQWTTGLSATGYVGSAAHLITTGTGWWRHGIWIDRAWTGITMGHTMDRRIGLNLSQSRLAFAPLAGPPDAPAAGTAEIYAQHTAAGKVQLIVRFANAWAILATEP